MASYAMLIVMFNASITVWSAPGKAGGTNMRFTYRAFTQVAKAVKLERKRLTRG